ncbi:MAG: tail fiber domain-containing protein [Bdellovibrio sp.]
MKRKNGFSILQALIAVAISLVGTMAILTIVNTMSKSNLSNQQQAEATYLHDDIYALLRDPKACLKSFSTFAIKNVAAPETSVTNLVRADDTMAFQVGSIWASNKLRIQKMSIGDFVPDDAATAPDAGKGWLHVNIEKLGQPIGAQYLLREIKLQVMRDPATKQVLSCVAIGGTKDIWLLNPDGSIFYNGGNVGIGKSSPSTPLEVDSKDKPGALWVDGSRDGTYHSSQLRLNDNQTIKAWLLTNGIQGATNNHFGLHFYDGSNYSHPLTILENGYVGLGTTNPNGVLDVSGDILFGNNSGLSSGGGRLYSMIPGNFGGKEAILTVANGLGGANDEVWIGPNVGAYKGHVQLSAEDIRFHNSSSPALIVKGDKVGIGMPNPSYDLHLLNDSAAKPGSSAWTIASDLRLKNISGTFNRSLKDIEIINPIYFQYKRDNPLNLPSDKKYVGVIAQDVQKSIPEAVQTDEQGFLHITNDAIIWTMLNSIKELHYKLTSYFENLAKSVSQKANIEDLSKLQKEIAEKNKEIIEVKTNMSRLEKENSLLKQRIEKIEKTIKIIQ